MLHLFSNLAGIILSLVIQISHDLLLKITKCVCLVFASAAWSPFSGKGWGDGSGHFSPSARKMKLLGALTRTRSRKVGQLLEGIWHMQVLLDPKRAKSKQAGLPLRWSLLWSWQSPSHRGASGQERKWIYSSAPTQPFPDPKMLDRISHARGENNTQAACRCLRPQVILAWPKASALNAPSKEIKEVSPAKIHMCRAHRCVFWRQRKLQGEVLAVFPKKPRPRDWEGESACVNKVFANWLLWGMKMLPGPK